MYKVATERGLQFLQLQCKGGKFDCFLGIDRTMREVKQAPQEVFSSILILSALGRLCRSEWIEQISRYVEHRVEDKGLIRFFENNEYPPDADDSALAASTFIELEREYPQLDTLFEQIITNTNVDGVVRVWFDTDRPNYVDHVVATNVIYLACLLGKIDKVAASVAYIRRVVVEGEWQKGSRYYHSPDIFFHFISRIIERSPEVFGEEIPTIRKAVARRIGKSSFPIDIAACVITAVRLGLQKNTWRSELEKLLFLQSKDGAWPADAICHYGGKLGFFGSKSISTALAVEALLKCC